MTRYVIFENERRGTYEVLDTENFSDSIAWGISFEEASAMVATLNTPESVNTTAVGGSEDTMYQSTHGATTTIGTFDNDTSIFISRYELPEGFNGWNLSCYTFPCLEVQQLPALPYLCQSTIDGMDADADTIEFGRYS